MSHVTDARDIIFADPDDMDTASDFSALSLDERIEHAEWQIEVALANLDTCVNDEDFARAAFDLKVAMAQMNDLIEERDAGKK